MLFHVVAVVFGVIFTLRKLDARRRESRDFPGVDPGAFELWKSTALRSYNLGVSVCFGYVVFDYVLAYGIARFLPYRALQMCHFFLLVSWIGLLVYAWVLSSRARGLQEKAGIRFAATPAPR